MYISLSLQYLRALTQSFPIGKSMNLSSTILSRLSRTLERKDVSPTNILYSSLRLLCKWRCVLIQNTLLKKSGTTVIQGPFSGLEFVRESAEGCHIPKLLGCYEQPLHPHIEALRSRGYEAILNIGCAEGYYAVGLARLNQNTLVYAFDIDHRARVSCKELALKNHVQDRVIVEEEFTKETFSNFSRLRTLVFCDIEGHERDILDATACTELRSMDVIVESHDCIHPGTTGLLVDRFKETHDITIVKDNGSRNLTGLPSWFNELENLDQLLSVWEWRSGPTPWLVMTAKSPNKSFI